MMDIRLLFFKDDAIFAIESRFSAEITLDYIFRLLTLYAIPRAVAAAWAVSPDAITYIQISSRASRRRTMSIAFSPPA